MRQRVQQNPPHGSILELLRSLIIEDSFHYLAYALLFYFAHPITYMLISFSLLHCNLFYIVFLFRALALVPTLVYSLLHASRFSKELLQVNRFELMHYINDVGLILLLNLGVWCLWRRYPDSRVQTGVQSANVASLYCNERNHSLPDDHCDAL